MPSEYSSASSARVSSCRAVRPPNGILMRCMPGASHNVLRPLGGLVGRVGELARGASVMALPVVVALAVDAAAQAGLGDQRFVQLAALA